MSRLPGTLLQRCETRYCDASRAKPRQAVEKAWDSNTIVNVPATNSFYSLDEAAVKLVYDAYLEY
jgi:hypothetical protein